MLKKNSNFARNLQQTGQQVVQNAQNQRLPVSSYDAYGNNKRCDETENFKTAYLIFLLQNIYLHTLLNSKVEGTHIINKNCIILM